ncbi:hypothetical protein GQ457_02G022510 [Hibiscus cannabinus]
MDKEEQRPQTSSHVLIFPLPAQGHVNSMLKLAELLALAGLSLTFLNSDFVHQQLLRHTHVVSRFLKYSGFQFRTIPDGLPDEHPRAGHAFMEIFETLESITKPIFKEMLVNMKPRVDCLLADGVLGIAADVAEELGIPIVQFRTISACSTWAYFAVPDMIQAGELPIKGKEDMDRLITSVPGMEAFLRCRDLPDMKDLCDRHIVEKMVNDLMVERREEFLKSATKMAKLAKECVNVGGSSYCNLDRLVEDIRSMNFNLGK